MMTKAKKAKKSKPAPSPLKTEYFEIEGTVYFALYGRAADKVYGMVSEDIWPQIKQYKWYLSKSDYIYTFAPSRVQLHRLVYMIKHRSAVPSHLYVDHIDRNRLNNTNENLRLATPQENSFNKTTKTNKKGVVKNGKTYTVKITKSGKISKISGIETEEQAVEIYNMMAEELHGSFASKNIKS